VTAQRIGIDYTSAVRQGAGIGRLTRELVRALIDLDTDSRYILLAATAGIHGVSPALRAVQGHPNVQAKTLPVSDRLLNLIWHRLRLPLWVEYWTGPLDIFHSPDFALPPVRSARSLVTVHDLSFMRVPECSDPRLRAYLARVVPASIRRADMVLADSKSTRDDVVALLGVDPACVEVVYAGVEERFQRVSDTEVLAAVRARYQLPKRFVLGLGTLQPRKNFPRLIEAHAQVRKKTGEGIGLVIAGGPGWMSEDIFYRMQELGIQDSVRLPGYVADEDLPALYSLADVFAFPSLYEGFGLPPLEAMACGTPVVASDVSSLPEVMGDAALMVNPYDVAALAEGIERLLSDAPLRALCIQRGLDQARQFTWKRSAAKLLQVYQRACRT